jgi:hypothetical protein
LYRNSQNELLGFEADRKDLAEDVKLAHLDVASERKEDATERLLGIKLKVTQSEGVLNRAAKLELGSMGFAIKAQKAIAGHVESSIQAVLKTTEGILPSPTGPNARAEIEEFRTLLITQLTTNPKINDAVASVYADNYLKSKGLAGGTSGGGDRTSVKSGDPTRRVYIPK